MCKKITLILTVLCMLAMTSLAANKRFTLVMQDMVVMTQER